MPWFDHIGNTLRALRVHLFGKGIMTLAVLGASALSAATGVAWVLPVVAIGGVALTAVNRLYREGQYQDDMVNLYRDDLALQFGVAPEEVGRAHLQEAAKTNDVLGQALKRQRNATYLSVGMAVVSSTITYLLVGAFDAHTLLKKGAETFLPSTAASLAGFVGIGTVAGLSGMVFKGGLQSLIGASTSVGKAAAHDRIMGLESTIKHGRSVSKEQVYGVLVAGDAKLQRAIQRQFHKSYHQMHKAERTAVLETIGVAGDMQSLAEQINRGDIRPGHLAYLMQDSGETPVITSAAAVAEAPPSPAAPVHASFVDRLGLAPQEQGSYREQIAAQRAMEAELQR